jgi:hypothetical protein
MENQNTQINDYKLLRDFNLEDAKAGAGICSGRLMTDLTFIAAHKNSVFVELSALTDALLLHSEEVKMKPLFWLEGEPVYKGDVVYHVNLGEGVIVSADDWEETIVNFGNGDEWCYRPLLSFAKPKTERKGWINIWKCSSSIGVSTGSQVYANKEAALRGLLGLCDNDLVDTIEITWME